MSQPTMTRRWIVGSLVAALLVLGTLGLRHVCSDAHASDGRTPDCAICRVVGASAAVFNDNSQLLCRLTAFDLLSPVPREAVIDVTVAASRSRGPPLLA